MAGNRPLWPVPKQTDGKLPEGTGIPEKSDDCRLWDIQENRLPRHIALPGYIYRCNVDWSFGRTPGIIIYPITAGNKLFWQNRLLHANTYSDILTVYFGRGNLMTYISALLSAKEQANVWQTRHCH